MRNRTLIETAKILIVNDDPDDAKVNHAFARACGWKAEATELSGILYKRKRGDVTDIRWAEELDYCHNIQLIIDEMAEGWIDQQIGRNFNTETWETAISHWHDGSPHHLSHVHGDNRHRVFMLAVLVAKEMEAANAKFTIQP